MATGARAVEQAGEEPLAAVFPPVDEEAWLAAVDSVLRGRSFDSLASRTDDGITVMPLYTRGSSPGAADEAGFPGFDPHTRGAGAAPRPHGLWDVRSVVSHPDPVEANRRALEDLERGVTSLTVELDEDRRDLSTRLDGVHLDLAPVILRPGPAFTAAAAELEALWADRGVDPTAGLGGYGADPLGAAATGEADPGDLDDLLAALGDLAARTAASRPQVRAVAVDTLPAVEAGASEAQELAVMLSTGAAYLRAMAAAGLGVDAACRQIEVTLGADADVFLTMAKIRAARRLWSAMTAACGAGESARAARIHVRTARRMLTERDPWVNLLRVTAAAFGAGVAGAEAVTVEPFDVLAGDPGDLGRRMARNTQLLLLEESRVGWVLDPAGGSWYVESLTEELAAVSWAQFQQLEADGGLPSVLLDGSLAERIASVRDARQRAVATRRRPITGVSEFPNLAEDPPVRRHRAAATRSTPLLVPIRWAEPFERLRDAAEAHRDRTGTVPTVFLVNLGPPSAHTARATFAKNLFEAGGIQAVTSERGAGQGFATPEEAVEDLRASGARIACLCSSDERYAEQATTVATACKAAGIERLYLAGNPGERREAEEAAGIDEFVHVGVDVLDVLRRAHEVLGIPAEVTR